MPDDDEKNWVKLGAVAVKGAMEINPKTPKSCRTAVWIEKAKFLKSKTRSEGRAWWESWMLEVWDNILSEYSKDSGLMLCSPRPMGLFFGRPADGSNPKIKPSDLFMSYASGDNVTKLGQYKRSERSVEYPKGHPGQAHKELFPAAAFYIGALSKIKENERLLHGDYQPRHVILDASKPCLWVIDVENSTTGDESQLKKEEDDMRFLLNKLTSGLYRGSTIDDAFNDGKSAINSGSYLLSDVVAMIEQKHGFYLDFSTRKAYQDKTKFKPIV